MSCEHKALHKTEDGYICIRCMEPVRQDELWLVTVVNSDEWLEPEITWHSSKRKAYAELRKRLQNFYFDHDDDELIGDEFTNRFEDEDLVEAVNSNPSMDEWNVDVIWVK